MTTATTLPPVRHYLQFSDLTADETNYLFTRAALIKKKFKAYEKHHPLSDRTLAMIFEKASTRTRVSFEAGMYQLGGSVVHLTTGDSQLGRAEPIDDSAKVISRMVDLVMIRTYEQTKIERFAAHSRVPVINGLTNEFHPCQILADIFTFIEHRGSIAGKTPGMRPSQELTEHLTECRRLHRRVERDIGDWLYVRYLQAAAGTDQVFNAEIIDVMRAGLKLRLQENGAVVFMPARHILDNKDRLECNWDNGRVYLDKTEVVYELGQIIEVKLSEAVEETRSLIAKPAVALVPGPAPEAPAAESTASESSEAAADAAPKAE